MRIDPRIMTGIAAQVARPGRSAGASTFQLDEEHASSTSAARSSAPLATLDAILMLQGEQDGEEKKRRSARRGQDLLDALDGLKAALLSGTVSTGDLQRLADMLTTTSANSGDEGLDRVVQAIELRARVEIAKLEMAQGHR